MQKYIIDGNNIIGKIKDLQSLQYQNKQAAREKLAFLIENYFLGKKVRVSLHFDGFPNVPIRMSTAKIVYSETQVADEKIKVEIAESKNPRNVTLITSDKNLQEFAHVCGVKVIPSEDFAAALNKRKTIDEEELRISSINNIEEFKKIFKVKK